MSKKIGSHEAFNIASRVASKAFEHLITPARERLIQVAMAAYHTELKLCGITPEIDAALRARGVLGDHTPHNCQLAWGPKNDSEAYYNLSFDEKNKPLFARISITNEYHKDQLAAAKDALTPLESKAYALACDIKAQINGKTTAVVRKHWPELTGFVEDVMREGINMNPISPVPFQTLLNKHLLALAAPTTAPAA